MSDKVSCSFCNEEFLPLKIGEHLMSCGNKTDQCPNCQKFIRRAIFAYHYENRCANLDEPETDVKAAVNRSEMPSTFQPNYNPPSASRIFARNDANTTTGSIDLSMVPDPTTVYMSQQSVSGTTYIVCPYCNHGCDPSHRDTHQGNCVWNPKNMEKNHQSQNNPTSNQNTRRLNHVDQVNDDTDIPCENCNRPIKFRDYDNHMRYIHEVGATYIICPYCHRGCELSHSGTHQANCVWNPNNMAKNHQLQNNPTSNQNTGRLNHVDLVNNDTDIPCENCNRPIKFRDYHNHMQACVIQNYRPILQQPQTIYRDDAPAAARCRYCYRQHMIDFVQPHERICTQNPSNTLELQLRAIYRPPPSYTPHYSS